MVSANVTEVVANVTEVVNRLAGTDGLVETETQFIIDYVLGFCFLVSTIVSAGRLKPRNKEGGDSTTVVTTFYILIFLTSVLRTIYFLAPKQILEPRYTPSAVMAFDAENPRWISNYASEVVQALGSLCLFSIFVLILVYWADILKKYFYPMARRPKPMKIFVMIVSSLVLIQVVSSYMFLTRSYSTEGMILLNSVLFSTLSIACVVLLLIYSSKFLTVLKTLGAINQVSNESQEKRIKWITLTGNAFFIPRALLEVVLAFSLIFHYMVHGSVDEAFYRKDWEIFVIFKYGSEFAILCLMHYILRSQSEVNVLPEGNSAKYDPIPEKEEPVKSVPVSNTLDV